MEKTSAYISGVGLVTPLGETAGATFHALMAGRFISDHYRRPGGADRGVEMALSAGEEAIVQAGWNASQRRDAGLIIGTSKGTLESLISPPYPADQHIAESTYIAAGEWNRFGIDGPRLVFSAACASSLHGLIRAAMMIGHGEADRVLVVGYEASVHPLFIASFRRLGIIPPDSVGCRPFDENRAGFLVSEAAAAVCMEAGSKGICIEEFALGGDATHLTGGDPDGKTLRRLLRRVIDGRAVDLVHAHGTGTEFNDPMELAAIESCCISPSPGTPGEGRGEGLQNGKEDCADRKSPSPYPSPGIPGEGTNAYPSIYSHKGAIGHSLGAAGLISVVLNCISHERNLIPPNIRTSNPLVAKKVLIHRTGIERPVRRSIAVAAGFGGAMGMVGLTSPG